MVEAAGGAMADVVKVTIYVTNIKNNTKVWKARAEFFTGDFPASTLVEVSALAAPEILVEIEAIAHIGKGKRWSCRTAGLQARSCVFWTASLRLAHDSSSGPGGPRSGKTLTLEPLLQRLPALVLEQRPELAVIQHLVGHARPCCPWS